MDVEKLCMGCMKELQNPGICPYCGFDARTVSSESHYLKPYTILNGKYLVGKVLGEGGFGITYIGYDLNLEMSVAIKEFYPNGFVTRESGVTSLVSIYRGVNLEAVSKWKNNFIREARTLAKCSHLSGIVGVKDFFEENGTAYIVMEYLEGITLKAYIKKCGGKIEKNQLFQSLNPVMASLAKVHEYGLIHRDISPDNIMLLESGTMKLLDFGAARDYSTEAERSLSVMLKPGYAPEEQYRTKGKQGPWSDVYAFAATIYKCITGITPPESMERMRQDELKKPSELGISITLQEESTILKGMAVYAEDRYQSIQEFMQALFDSAQDGNIAVSAVKQMPIQPQVDFPSKSPSQKTAETQNRPKTFHMNIGIGDIRAWCLNHKVHLAAAGIMAAVVCVFMIILKKNTNEESIQEVPQVAEEMEAIAQDVEESEEVTEKSPEEKAKEALENGSEKYEEGDYDAAFAYFEEARGFNPDNEEVYLLESDCYIQQGDYEGAVSILNEGIAQTGKITLDTRKEYLLENIVLIRQEKYCNGILQETREYNPDSSLARKYLYDTDRNTYEWEEYTYTDGVLTSEVYFYENGSQKWGIAYNEDGSENVYAAYDQSGQMTEVYVAEYDGNGMVSRKIYYETNGLTIRSGIDRVLNNGVKWWKTYVYDQYGNQVEDVSYNKDGSVSSYQEYYYDMDGNMTGYAAFYGDGAMNVYGEYVYDENGKKLSAAEFDAYGNMNRKDEYEYDALGNCKKELSYYTSSDEADEEVECVNVYQLGQ